MTGLIEVSGIGTVGMVRNLRESDTRWGEVLWSAEWNDSVRRLLQAGK